MKNHENHTKEEISLYQKRFKKGLFSYRTSDWDEKRKLKALKLLKIFDYQGARILDFGCGTATYTPYLHRSFEKVIGIDISPSNIEIAKIVDSKSIYVCADGLNLPFEDEYFDAVFVGQVLHHFKDLKAPLIEINRVLRKNGFLFNIEPNDWNPLVSWKYRKRIFKKNKTSFERHHAIGYLYIKSKLKSSGFKIMNKQGINFTPPKIKGFWNFIQVFEPYIESSPLNLFGGSLLITARKLKNVK